MKIYILNQAGVPEDHFNWLEAFETWCQRRGTTANWKCAHDAPGQWTATVVLFGQTFDGLGPSKQQAKNDAIIKIERARILN